MTTETGGAAGCVFPLDGAEIWPGCCGKPRHPGSSYCPEHHARCHLAAGSLAEWRRLQLVEALAWAAGGRIGAIARDPPAAALQRLDRLSRLFLSRNRSRFVSSEGATMTRSRPNTVAAAQSATGDLAAVGDLASPAD